MKGNELYKKQDFVGALVKYSDALALDDKNAVLYANRAACSHGLNKYLDAVDDAQLVTELDPGYAKGWSRLAAAWDALADWRKSADAWQKALNVLPTTNLSPAQRQQRDQYRASLKAAQARIEATKKPIVPLFKINAKEGKFPWQVAAEILTELWNIKNISSSAWVIAYAYQEFTTGVNKMKELKLHAQAPEKFGCYGSTDALAHLTNDVLRDDRAFHIDQPDWISMYNKQVMFEATARHAWDSEGLETIKEQAQKRLKEKGWNDVRPALSVTVRAWIMKASLDGSVRQKPHSAVQHLKRALDLLEWGQTIWKDFPKSDRGTIFEDTFVAGVRAFYLKTFMNAYSTDPGLNSKFPLEQLKEEAEDLVKETDRVLQNPTKEQVDPGFFLSFTSYPAGIAHSMIGLYHVQMAQYGSDPVEGMFSFIKGAKAYLDAADKYPEDDESHSWFLNSALDCMRHARVRVGEFNQVAIRLQEAAPKMMKIWALSSLAKVDRDQRI
ncbi:hypothetical protein K503DRAFT_851394 [Rhizopogon vinicolor AM-OR11-026]|uniref:Uncharacterized protein n=1 Tax=Rhizopogon vinicolor AM-OR11-026 TaxID=1314800 RepID=A0A1B7MR43_9AGAM|nr:hypothetical protein K503DRAFT_851394 [Rhizopogon vinicolor AM-OR11-026]